MKNHFIIVGAQRSGTTYLYNLLDEHPEIYMAHPVRPEPKYFLDKNPNELDLSEYYRLFFQNCTDKYKVYGEKSTSYYENMNCTKLIHSLLPDTKIIFILRNPVDRALSNYQFSYNNGLENRSLEDVFINEIKSPRVNKFVSVDPFDYLERGNYTEYIKNYMQYFSQNKIKILIFEEFLNNKNKIQDLYSFLGVDSNFVPNKINTVINSSKRKFDINSEVINKIHQHFASQIIELEELLNIDLSIWKI